MNIAHMLDHARVAYGLAVDSGNRDLVFILGVAVMAIEQEACRLKLEVRGVPPVRPEPALQPVPH